MDHDRKWTEFTGYDEGMGNNFEEDHNMKGLRLLNVMKKGWKKIIFTRYIYFHY